MQFIKFLAVLAIFSGCSLSHSFKFEHEIKHALQVAEKVAEDIMEDDSVTPSQKS